MIIIRKNLRADPPESLCCVIPMNQFSVSRVKAKEDVISF